MQNSMYFGFRIPGTLLFPIAKDKVKSSKKDIAEHISRKMCSAMSFLDIISV